MCASIVFASPKHHCLCHIVSIIKAYDWDLGHRLKNATLKIIAFKKLSRQEHIRAHNNGRLEYSSFPFLCALARGIFKIARSFVERQTCSLNKELLLMKRNSVNTYVKQKSLLQCVYIQLCILIKLYNYHYTVTGTPPSFDLEPQDTVVFQRNSASLVLNCNASGDPSPTIAWYREGTRLSSELVMVNGSLVIENLAEGMDATRGGLSYHCTANNTFGTIRSRTANVSYACELRGEAIICQKLL